MGLVRERPAASEDLRDIWRYVALDNPESADHLLDSILTKLNMLADNPMLGRARADLAPALRSFTFRQYVLLYEPEPGGVLLIRVLHGARDIARALLD